MNERTSALRALPAKGGSSMTWNSFRYSFDGAAERAMFYSICEAIRRQCSQPGGGNSVEIATDAVATFRRKMEKHTGGPLAHPEQSDCIQARPIPADCTRGRA